MRSGISKGCAERGSAALTGPLRTAAGFALHSGLQSDGDARLMGMTAAAGGALGGGGRGGGAGGSAGAGGSEAKAISTDPDDGGVLATPAELYDEKMASGDLQPRPKGPKPILGWSEASEGEPGAGNDGGVRSGQVLRRAWKWQGVPPGRSFLYPVEPGKHRFYIDYDEQGPKMVGLPPAWPSDDPKGDG